MLSLMVFRRSTVKIYMADYSTGYKVMADENGFGGLAADSNKTIVGMILSEIPCIMVLENSFYRVRYKGLYKSMCLCQTAS